MMVEEREDYQLELPLHMKQVPALPVPPGYQSGLSSAALSDNDEEAATSGADSTALLLEDVECMDALACGTGMEDIMENLLPPVDLPVPARTGAGQRDEEKGSSSKYAPTSSATSSCKRFNSVVLYTALVVLIVVLSRGYLLPLLQWLEGLPFLESLFVFVLLFTLVAFPCSFGFLILNMAAGYLYGFVKGEMVVTLAGAVGFSISFLMCRRYFQDCAQMQITNSTFLAIMRVVEGRNGFKVIALSRITPIPFGLQNALFAVCLPGVRVCCSPVCVCVYVYYVSCLCARCVCV